MERKGEKVDTKYNLKVYLGFLKNYKLLVFLLFLTVLIHESKQIAEKFLLKKAVDGATGYLAQTLPKQELVQLLLILAGIYFLFTLTSTTVNWLKIHLNNKLDAGLIRDLKSKFFQHILSLDHKFYTTHKTGSLISRLSRGSSAMEKVTDSLIYEFSPLIIQIIVLSFSLIYLDKTSALILIISVAVFLLFNILAQKKLQELQEMANTAEDTEKANVSDAFTNIDSIKYFGKEGIIFSKYKNLINDTLSKSMVAWGKWRLISAGQSFILGVSTLVMLVFSFKKFLAGEITLGTITFIYTTFFSIFGPLFSFVHGLRNFSRSMADFQDLFQYGKIESNIKDSPNAKELKIKKGEIEFRNISFAYEKNKIFENFSLKIPENKKVAFVGHSGSGKTSLVKLLYRLYDVQKGEILIDNQNIKDLKQESLRSEMSVVPQECILFDDTIFNNIKFSNPNATREQVLQAIKFAQLDKIISKMPKKENTIVGERGVKLSGGEKQRVSIARAILANKKILALDEATSALDSETEYEIKKDLEKLMEGRTSIIIAHRLSTIMHADIIVVMKEGKIVQQGKHSELINQTGEYKKLWNLQKGGYLKE